MSTLRYKVGFIGCGNMGGALARAALRATESVAVADRSSDKLSPLVSLGATALTAEELARTAELIFLGVKPQGLPALLDTLAEALRDNADAVLVSMAAAVSIRSITDRLSAHGVHLPVIRILPNTPAAVGCGMTLYTTSDELSDEALTRFLDVMKPSGELLPIEEERIDAAGTVSGCGPAFAYMFAEALADGGVSCGLSREHAQRLAAQMLLGAAEMLKTYGHPADLKDAVCSPGGTTIEGVRTLEEEGLRGAVIAAVRASYEKTLKLRS